QAEDGIRDDLVTGVQTCALPISTCSFLCDSTSDVVQPTAQRRLVPGFPFSGLAWRREAICLWFAYGHNCTGSTSAWFLRETETRSEERRVGTECRSVEST